MLLFKIIVICSYLFLYFLFLYLSTVPLLTIQRKNGDLYRFSKVIKRGSLNVMFHFFEFT